MAIVPQSTCGLVAMTSASHAKGRQFDPGQVYFMLQNVIPSSADDTHLLVHSRAVDAQVLPPVLPACFAGVIQLRHVPSEFNLTPRRDAPRCLSCRGRADPAAVLTPGPCRPRVQRRVRVNAGAVLIPWPHRRRAELKSDTRGRLIPSRGFFENSNCK